MPGAILHWGLLLYTLATRAKIGSEMTGWFLLFLWANQSTMAF